MVDDNPVIDDAPMESSEEAPVAKDEQNEGEGNISDAAAGDEDRSTAPHEEEDETKSVSTAANMALDEDVGEDEEEEENRSVAASSPAADETIMASPETAPSPVVEAAPPKKKRGKPQIPASARKGRAPAVKGLNIPFRTVKKVSFSALEWNCDLRVSSIENFICKSCESSIL